MNVAVLIASRNRPDLVEAQVTRLRASTRVPHDVYVVECGTEPAKLSPYATLWYRDEPFRGKCHGHHLALQQARASGRYTHYLVLMNDVLLEDGVDALQVLVETMAREPRMAILSPTERGGAYPGAARRPGGGWRKVTTCDYLGFLMRAEAVEQVGFLDPAFAWCWGAIHELAYELYSAGWFVAYSDDVSYEHLGGSTYGVPGTNTVSREEYQRQAKRFAHERFRARHGPDWPATFWRATAGHAIEIDTFALHARLWAESETPATASRELVRLHLGCGSDYREGWINVDCNPAVRADLRAEAEALPTFADGSVDAIEANHLFEHLTLPQARRALREWRRVLRPGGELALELPDLEACIRILGQHTDEHGCDLGMTGLYGWVPDIEREGLGQVHKWGWSRDALRAELQRAGFGEVAFGPIAQTWRPAAKLERDMRVRARVPAAPSSAAPTLRALAAAALPAGALAAPDAPWPLRTESTARFFAWPRYDDPADLDHLLGGFGRELAGRAGACLVLRRDPQADGPRESVAAAIEQAYLRTLGADARLEVLLLDAPLEGGDWRRVGRAVTASLLLPSASGASRARALSRLGARMLASPAELRALLGGAPPAPPPQLYPREVLDTVDYELVACIDALHPWFFPATFGNLKVAPGKGSSVSAEFLERHAACRQQLLVDAVVERVDLRGKAVLELACNCGWWSARYAERGAARVVGLEGRERFVRQAELYWSSNAFLPRDAWAFLHGNVSDPAAWEELRRRGPYDLTLVAGVLYHVPNYREVLAWSAALTRELLVVDTRVGGADEPPVDEPGELHFNPIDATRRKVVPNLDKLLATLRDLGFAPEVLPVPFERGPGTENVDDYTTGARVCVVARKVRSALAPRAALPAGVPAQLR